MLDTLREIEAYKQYIKQNPYVYSLQKQGIDLFIQFLKQSEQGRLLKQDTNGIMNYFLSIWLPRNKKYLTDVEAFNIVYTLQDFEVYLEQKYQVDADVPLVLDSYRNDYVRVYQAKRFLDKMVGDPIVSTNPMIIHLGNYKEKKQKMQQKDSMCLYEQGVFKIEEINKEGYIGLTRLGGSKYCKVLCRPNMLHHFKERDLLHVSLKKKIFFVYWEIQEIKAYYPEQAAQYL